MKLKNYLIWEKQQWNNKGISVKLTTSPYCYIKPTMCSTWSDYDRRPYFDKPYDHYFICQEKTIFWLWFRLTFKIDIEKKHTLETTSVSEDLFEMLPSFINVDGELYHFNMIKGKNGPMITYKTNSDIQLANVKYMPLGSTYRTGDNLRDVCKQTVNWLMEFDYVKYMPYGYKEKYETMFKTKIEHSRGFDR